MKIDDNFRIETDAYNVILIETKDGINPKTKEATRSETKYYYPNVTMALSAFVDAKAKQAVASAKDLEELQRSIKIVESMLKIVEEVKKAVSKWKR